MSTGIRPSHTHIIPFNPARPCRGAVMVIALLSLILLASLVFYVFNVGHHVAKKVETQNAADAAAISGAGWVARSFNTVAMNNVETTRLIAYAAVLDAVPQAIDYTITDQTAVRDAIDQQLARGVGTDPWLRDGLLEAQRRTDDQLAMLRPLQEVFDTPTPTPAPAPGSQGGFGASGGGGGYDVGRMTYYRPPAGAAVTGSGDLWQAIEALSDLSRATMENLTPLAAQNAAHAADVTQAGGRDATASGLLLPRAPDIPWEQGSFEDFRLPVLNGRLPPRQDDPLTNRGPFDTLFGFHDFRFAPAPGSSTPIAPARDISETSGGLIRPFRLQDWAPSSPESNTPSSGGRAVSYDTYGAYRAMRRRGMDLSRSPQGHASGYQGAWPESRYRRQHPLAPSLWARHLSFLADRKINFCFSGAASNRVVRQPQWILNYDEALEIERTGQPSIGYGLYLVFDYARNELIGGVDLVHPPPVLQNWGLYQAERDILNPPGLTKVADHIWLDQHVETLRTSAPGSSTGEGTPYRRRTVRYYVFVGVQVGEPAAVRNPFNFDAEDRNTLPGPINFSPELDQSQQKYVPGAFGRDDGALTYLGIAYQSKQAPMWSDAFDDNRPDRHQVAVAQAQVFNNHSWDLWTQMWHSQLTPIENFDAWLDRLDATTPLNSGNSGGDEGDLAAVRAYIRATQPLVELMSKP